MVFTQIKRSLWFKFFVTSVISTNLFTSASVPDVILVHVGKDNGIYYWNGAIPESGGVAWTKICERAQKVALGYARMLYMDSISNEIYYSDGFKNGTASWKKQSGTWASSVAIGSHVKFSHIGRNNSIFYCDQPADTNNGSMPWKQIDGTAIYIALDASGKMACIGKDNAIYYSAGIVGGKANWIKQRNTWAASIAIGTRYNPTRTVAAHIGHNNKIYYFEGTVNSNGSMDWKQIDGTAKDITIGFDGRMACVGMDNAIYYSAGVVNGKANWKKLPGTWASSIAIQ